MDQLSEVFWFFLPAAVANMAPIIFSRLPVLDVPVDFGKKLGGRPILGPHKTWRGLLVGIAAACLVVYIQQRLYPWPHGRSIVNYDQTNFVWLGLLLGFGALGGDMLKSFFKRRLGITSGRSWVPFDQIDWILGALALSSIVADFTSRQVVIALVVLGLAHPLTSLFGYKLGLKKNKF